MTSVLHVGSIAGVPQELSRCERRLGLKSDVISFQPHPFGYETDFFRPTHLPFPFRYLEKMHSIYKAAGDYDIIHFHYSSILPFGLDLPLWKMLAKKIVFHYHGDDIRNKGEGILSRCYAGAVLVSTPDLLAWSPRAIWSPNPIDLKKYAYVGVKDHSGSLRVVHAPSDPLVKGTEYVVRAVEELKKEGYNIDLDLVENMPHHEAVEHYRRADIVVDQLLVGWYGVFAIECMALGKPVCVYIKGGLKKYLDGSPLIDADPTSIKQRLIELIENQSLRQEIGRRGREYVERIHDADVVCRRTAKEIYGL
jgi:glycosyltransferase involved in cell wall biosynthesis